MNIFSVEHGRPFLDALAGAILAGQLPQAGGPAPDVLDLPAITILLPTRRASRALAEAFHRASGRSSLLLPRIVPISEGDADAGLLAALAGADGLDARAADLPPAIDPLARQLTLARLVLQWSLALRGGGDGGDADVPSAGARSTAEAIKLAGELAKLMDMVETEGADLGRLAGLVPDGLSQHWTETLEFLKIITTFWPEHLLETGLLSPAERRNHVLRGEAQRLATGPTSGPVIVAGVTGSIPATVDVIRAVAGRSDGAIVLPAMDFALDAESWSVLLPDGVSPGHPEHPQFGLAKLLAAIGTDRAAVKPLPGAGPAVIGARTQLLSEALRPAATTERWGTFLSATSADDVRAALAGVSLVEAANAAEEAEVVALVLRQALETPGTTAALVSPDRRLARRVAQRLKAWNITIDDSAGRPFAKTPPGTFLELIIDVVRRDFAPSAVVALLGHPLMRLGRSAREIRFGARALEIAAFRAVYVGRGAAAIAEALGRAEADKKRQSMHARRLWPEDWARARSLAEDLAAAFEPLIAVWDRGADVQFARLAEAHAAVAERLAGRPADEEEAVGGSALWQGEAGEMAALIFARLADGDLGAPDLPPAEYPDVFRALFGMETVRLRGPVHPRLSIWGPFEARLQQPDIVVLGSLNDGVWPEAADPGPWLNRPMRQTLGLPSPEERIGHAAHDVWALLGARTVIMTRALKADGAPTIKSRWLLRLEALIEGAGAKGALQPEAPWLAYARHRDRSEGRVRCGPPRPVPDLSLRPRKLSVSSVETWIANPYALFAQKILRLEPLSVLDLPPDASLRGSVLHDALRRFALAYPEALPDEIDRHLMEHIQAALTDYSDVPRVAAFWLPRFERFAAWFADTEAGRRPEGGRVLVECDGALVLPGPAGPFTLTARADRLDLTPQGLIITDYKTGQPPSSTDVGRLRAPQLPLEAAMVFAGGFPGVPTGPVLGLRYIRAGGGDPPGDEKTPLATTEKVTAVAHKALSELTRLIARYDDPVTPYLAARRPQFIYAYDDYAHLARVGEWAADGGDGE